jgi:glutathione S-transferase
MIELVQFPWSPFCLVQHRILEFSGCKFRIRNIPINDRTSVWRLTRQRYYQVPVLKDGASVVFETDDDSQVIAKYIDNKLQLGLFPPCWAGVQNLIWRAIESEVEGLTFKLNDIYYGDMLPAKEHLAFIRHKERKFGRHCIEQWREQQGAMVTVLGQRLQPFEQMLGTRPYLLDDRPRFIDFDLWGMLANYLYSGHYELPAAHTRLSDWYKRMTTLKHTGLSA